METYQAINHPVDTGNKANIAELMMNLDQKMADVDNPKLPVTPTPIHAED